MMLDIIKNIGIGIFILLDVFAVVFLIVFWIKRDISATLGVFTNGRPMSFLCHGFVDIVTGEYVGYYSDTNGKIWMATSKWDTMRVAASSGYTCC